MCIKLKLGLTFLLILFVQGRVLASEIGPYHYDLSVYSQEVAEKKKTIKVPVSGTFIAKREAEKGEGTLMVSGLGPELDGEYTIKTHIPNMGKDKILAFLCYKDGRQTSWSYSTIDQRLQQYENGAIAWFDARVVKLLRPSLALKAAETEKEDGKANGEKDSELFTIVEKLPVFPGGTGEMYKYIGKAISYPAKAKKKGIEGSVFLSFVVEADGSVSNVWVARGIGGGCDEPAALMVRNMPNWSPGTQRGKAVRVAYVLPLKFTLN